MTQPIKYWWVLDVLLQVVAFEKHLFTSPFNPKKHIVIIQKFYISLYLFAHAGRTKNVKRGQSENHQFYTKKNSTRKGQKIWKKICCPVLPKKERWGNLCTEKCPSVRFLEESRTP